MDSTQLDIRAKKISQLEDYPVNKYQENSYLIIGYNNGTDKSNFKISLRNFINLIDNNITPLDDNTLITKINSFINQHKIELSGAQGPQGPQGPKGDYGDSSDTDLSEIKVQIADIYKKINQYHSSYTITYNLSNIISRESNPNSIGYGMTSILYFEPYIGYKMPDNVYYNNCEMKNYDKLMNSITIANPTNNITITIIGEKQKFTISYSFTNINYEIINNKKSSYELNETIRLELTPVDGYKLPSSLLNSNCDISYLVNSDGTANLLITCNGTGNMIISGNAVLNTIYYFGFIAESSSSINVTYDYYSNDGGLKGIQSVSMLSMSALIESTSFNYNDIVYTINDISTKENVILIINSKFFNASSSEFINGNSSYKLYPNGFPVALSFTEPYITTVSINNDSYYAILITDVSQGSQYIIK